MAKAMWKGEVLAESDRSELVEGNVYFPPESVKRQFLSGSDTHTTCPWKGVASYYNLEAGGETAKDAAWYYPEPKEAASFIKGFVAFGGDVKVER